MIMKLVLSSGASFVYAWVIRFFFRGIVEMGVRVNPEGMAFALVISTIVWALLTGVTIVNIFEEGKQRR